MKKKLKRGLINYILLLTGFITCFSGIFIQIRYHITNAEGLTKIYNTSLGLLYDQWRSIHIISSILFALLCLYHAILHKRWYSNLLKKRLENRSIISATLSCVFTLLNISIILPFNLIEIHDKIGLIFILLLCLHLIKKL